MFKNFTRPDFWPKSELIPLQPLNRAKDVRLVNSSLGASGPLAGVVLGALSSIGTSVAKLAEHEKKFEKKYLSLPQAHPEIMTRSKKPVPKAVASSSSSGVARRKIPRATQMVVQPTSRGGVTRNTIPRSLPTLSGLTISHCEPFATTTLTAAGVLSYSTLAIIPSVFSYLNGIAANFAKYTWLKLHIYYVPSCPTSTQGECAMGNYYDWQDAGGATFLQTAQMKNGISFPPWGGGPEFGADAVTIDVDVKDFDKPRYNYVTVATFNALTSSDKNNYAPVNLAIATQGSTAAVSIAGRIWIGYTIRLIDPIPSGINA